MGMNNSLNQALVHHRGLISLRQHPSLRYVLRRAHHKGHLQRILPGIYCVAGQTLTVELRAHAAALADPDSVIGGEAAAALTWWPQVRVDAVQVTRHHQCAPAPGYCWRRGVLAPELTLTTGGMRLASPPLAVLDMIPRLGGRAIDEALRRRAVTLPELEGALALTPGRRGNLERAWLLQDSRDEPWSPPERLFHRHLRAARITGWVTNFRVDLGVRAAFLDVALPSLMLAFEIDGHTYHSSRTDFERDRERDAALAALGWQVVRLSAASVDDRDATMARVARIIAHRSRSFPGR